ncbi:DUF2239 family protein [Microbulbifer sp. OS29]|uniref:DUF2239 family protein n=1 Tax=Microbulbifer okhotskensis TaxID=2926617 RepID=A0A9X2J4B7_9GAMM|nr:DUF2239 family protein [Microbulbifer okhotskensis]MCO1334377.1 DUF2239 family protein [Microbulbifer okhotskensis]
MAIDYIAIHQQRIIARGTLQAIARQVKTRGNNLEPIVFERESCKRVEVDWHGDIEDVLARLATDTPPSKTKRGRPKLGVIPKEVTLLPRHWEWLRRQPGGASVTLRKLVEQAQKHVSPEERITLKQQQLDGLMLLVAGDAEGFEDASRALYRNSKISFETATRSWPDEIKQLVLEKFNEIAEMHSGTL